ncbi:LPS translocon maturation chaperone LptM [Arsukibacterium sp.]|uniref:LPS translocon maturation chaperone LptM n=1 Tax=Arsukibacterium sp. TaxID=1977258 RepID=UPI002FDA2982
MNAKRIIRQISQPLGWMLVGSMLTACGQKGPLTLPQPATEVAEPAVQNLPEPTDNKGDHSG